ncbi:MAG: ABC transporter transmembrane domain-containing protein, partial [Sedimenticolaceae bacterium]
MRHQPSDIERSPSRDIGNLRHLFGFLLPYRTRLTLAALALFVAAGAVLAFGVVIRDVVDRGIGSGNGEMLNQSLLLFLAVVSVMALSVGARVYVVNWLGERVVADVRKAVFSHVLTLDAGFFETTRTGEVISRLTADTTLLQAVVGSTLATSVRNLLLVLGGVVMLLITSVKLTLLVLIGVPLVVVPVWLLGRRVRRLSRISQDRIADVASRIDEVLYGIRTVQAFRHEEADRRAYGEQVDAAFAAAVARAKFSGSLTSLVMLLTFAGIGLVLWFGGQDVLAGRMTGGELSAFVFFAVLVAGSVGALSEVAGELMRAAGATERLMDLLATRSAVVVATPPVALPDPAKGRVAFRGVGFSYPSRPDQHVIDGLDLIVEPGETVALVGPSGAGKSTLLQLLLRYYDPQVGRVELDGVDLRRADPDEVRRRIAIVPQEPVIFGATARENIAYGMDVSDADIQAAVDAAHAREFIDRLPDGLDTYLGERGVRLSGGQKQRIAIARALLRDPAVLLLDEATSALDAHSEKAVQLALEELMEGRSTLVIAHRLATVRKADRIVVMQGGRIVAMGRHEALVAEGGLYAGLAALQFRDGVVGTNPS